MDGEGEISDIDFRIVESRAVEIRPYRWPTRWDVQFTHQGSRWRLTAGTMALEEVADWEKGGFAMSVVKGEVVRADGTGRRAFRGWAELLI